MPVATALAGHAAVPVQLSKVSDLELAVLQKQEVADDWGHFNDVLGSLIMQAAPVRAAPVARRGPVKAMATATVDKTTATVATPGKAHSGGAGTRVMIIGEPHATLHACGVAVATYPRTFLHSSWSPLLLLRCPPVAAVDQMAAVAVATCRICMGRGACQAGVGGAPCPLCMPS